MFFYLSKILWFLLQPSSAIALLILGGVLLMWRRPELGRKFAAAGVAALIVCGLSPLGRVLTLTLEDRFPRPDLSRLGERVDGIVVLGGVVDPGVSEARDAVSLNEAAERIVDAVDLARRYPKSRIVFTGGSAQIAGEVSPEAGYARRAFEQLGIDPLRIAVEDRSRNTHENAVFTRDLVKPQSGETWLLVTSAAHMPRAVGCFRKANFAVVPYPVDYRSRDASDVATPFWSISDGLQRLDVIGKEFAGLVAYYWTGRTDALFPAP